MASYNITGNDYKLTSQSINEIQIKIDVYDDYNHYLDTILCGVISANFSISSDSDVRRTCSLSLIPIDKVHTIVDEDGLIWLNRNIEISIGIKDIINGQYTYYKQGTYIIISSSSTYDATTNTLSLSCSDWVAKLDGTRNGNLGQFSIVYPAYYDYFSSLWVDEAKNSQVNVDDINAVMSWVKANPSDEYHNVLTESDNQEIYNALYYLTYKPGGLSQAQKDNYLRIINNICPKAELYEYRTLVSDTPVVITTIREFNVIREAMDNCIRQLGYIKDTNIDDIGESKGMPNHFPYWDYLDYRKKNPHWDKIPYDLEYAKGCTVWEIISGMRDLYEKYQCYFDINNTFCCDLAPRGYGDRITFDNNFLQSIIISENNSINFEEVKNVTEVWGAILEADWFAQAGVTYQNNVYSATIDKYTDETHTTYYNGDLIAIKVPSSNGGECYLRVNGLEPIPIYDENYEIPIDGTDLTMNLEAGETYVFKIVCRRENGQDIRRAYLLGQYQCHAMCVLTDGTVGEIYNATDGKSVKKYSKEFFQSVYAVDNVYMDVIPNSPFTVQKIGIILNVYDDESNIQSTSTALETARQENYRSSRLTDNISIVTKLVPYADVNQKVEYQKKGSDVVEDFLVTSLSHDVAGGTTSWTLVKYYPQYINTEE